MGHKEGGGGEGKDGGEKREEGREGRGRRILEKKVWEEKENCERQMRTGKDGKRKPKPKWPFLQR